MGNPSHAILTALLSAVVAAVAAALLARLAPMIGLVDRPGGRKVHASPVPLVGGIAIAIAIVVGEFQPGGSVIPSHFIAATIALLAVSVWDDFIELHPFWRFVGQIVAVLVMVYGADVYLHNVGDLLGWRLIGLWALGVPITVFAVVGVINAVNMIDGMDGLAGSMGLVAFAWYGTAAVLLGDTGMAYFAWLLCGAMAGFLLLNMRLPWQPQARVFLGDTGSTLVGFALAWFAIDLTQGGWQNMHPIAAVWVVLIPLADTLSLIWRRLARGHNPFKPDREHIHHFLLARGLSVNQALAVLVGLSATFGAVGVLGWRAGLAEPVLFWSLMTLFFAYHFAIKAAWRRIGSPDGEQRAG